MANIKIRNLNSATDSEVFSGNMLAGALDEDGGFAKLTRSFTFNQVVSGGLQGVGSEASFLISDQRLKRNLSEIEEPTKKITSLNGFNFIWNDLDPEGRDGRNDIGLIAQDVQEVVPEAVKTNSDGHLGVYYYKLVPLLIEALKEQEKRISELEKRIKNV